MAVIVLDRDGVINADSDAYVKSEDEWQPLPGSIHAIAELCAAGYTVAVATNQSGLGRGLFTLDALDAMHSKMRRLVEDAGGTIAMIAFCPHTPKDLCACRKPGIGLLQSIHAEFPLDPDTTWMVGDTDKDIQAAARMGIRGALVETGKGKTMLTSGRVSRETTPVFVDLAHFTKWLLAP